jgi:hypothetical protein
MPRAQKVNVAYTPGRGASFPLSSTIGTPAVSVFTSAPWQIGGVQVSQVSLVYPAASFSGEILDQVFNLPLTSFPQPINLTSTSTGIIYVSLALSTVPPNGATVVTVPLLQVVYGYGSPVQSAGGGTATFTLQPGGTYSNLALHGFVRVYAPYAMPQQTLTFTVWAMLLGQTTS